MSELVIAEHDKMKLEEEKKKFARDNVLLSIENMNSIPISVIQNKKQEWVDFLKTKNLSRWERFGANSRIEELDEILEEGNK